MKQHDLLVLLCKTHPNVFTITISFKERVVFIDAGRMQWRKVIAYAVYKEEDLEKLSKEIIDEYGNARARKEVFANGRVTQATG